MKYAIELFFDKELENRIFHYAKRIAQEKLSTKYLEYRTRPHITLACFQDVHETQCIEKLKLFARDHQSMPAHIGSLGMFPDTKTIFLSPIMTSAMYRFHRELHVYMHDFDTHGGEYYLPDRWVPHCAIALMRGNDESTYYKTCDLILHEFEKSSGIFASIGLVKISFPVEEIYIAKLKGEPSCQRNLSYY